MPNWDAPGQPISSLQFSTQENNNSPLTFTAELISQPTDTVKLYFFSSNTSEGQLKTADSTTNASEVALTFTLDNWNKPQSFSVVPQNDDIADGQIRYAITHRAQSQDPTYNDTNNYKVDFGIADRLIDLGKANNQISASNPNSPTGEEKDKAFDNITTTKWLIFEKQGWLQYPSLDSAAIVNSYSLTSANDSPERDPQNWELLGSNDGQTFEVLDRQSEIKFSKRFETQTFQFNNAKAYRYYRLNVLANGGANELQLAEFNLHVKDQLVIANRDDNDRAGLTVTPLSSVTEGAGDAFTIKLNSQPVGKVVVTMTPQDEEFNFLGKKPGDTHSITFDSQNWSTPQTIQITAVDDDKVEYLKKSAIAFQVNGEDPKYNSLSTTNDIFFKPLEVIIKDNDIPTARITPGKAAAEIFSTPGYFIIQLDRDPNNLPPDNTGIEVNYKIVGGTATLNADYQSIGTTNNTGKVRVFGNEVLLPIVPIDDKKIEDVTFTINKVTSGTPSNGKTTLTLDISARGIAAPNSNIIVTASDVSSSPNGEQKESAADNNSQTKWLIRNNWTLDKKEVFA